MDLVKKNLVSIICGVVAVAAIVALFWPVSGYFAELRQKTEARQGTFTSMKSLLTKERHMPVIDLNTTEPQVLNVFPTQSIIEEVKKVTDQVNQQANAIFESARKLNERPPLIPGALPDGASAEAIRFRQEYQRRFGLGPRGLDENSFPFQIMKAGFPPSAEQIAAAKQKRAEEITANAPRGPTGQPMNQDALNFQLQQEIPKIADQLKADAAAKVLMYVEPNALDPNVMLASQQGGVGAAPVPTLIYNAQVGLWIQEDVCRSLAAANRSSRSVVESPVKHLIKIDLPDEIVRADGGFQASPEGTPPPNPDPSADIPKNFTLSMTGRTNNGVYDVVPFTLIINVDAEQIPLVLQELSRNKFVTVTNCSVKSVDSAFMQSRGYFYGDKPVVELNMQCEALLLRKWTEPLMPLRVKQALGINPPPQQPGM